MKIKRIVLIASIATLAVGSGFGVYFTVQTVKKKQRDEELRRLFEEHYNSRLALFEEENKTAQDVDIVFLGDSLTEGYDVESYYPDYNVLNRGIGGDTTIGLEKRLKVSAYDANPKMIFMLIGANNFSTMLDNYENIVISIRENLPNTNLNLLSLTSMCQRWGRHNQDAINNNKVIKSYAEKYNLNYIDLFNPLLDPEKNELKEEYTVDGGHLTPAGYEVVTAQIMPICKAYLAK